MTFNNSFVLLVTVIDRSPVEFPEPMEESSLEDPAPDPAIAEAEVAVITYEIVLEGTKRQKRKLVDSAGYSYNVKERGRTTTYWQCTVRPKGNYCRATVKETDGNFVPGRQSHNHPPQVGALKAAHIMTQVKRKAMEDIFKPASAIVEEVMFYKMSINFPLILS